MKHGSADRLCVVSDVSLNGAKIVVQGDAAIPTHFELAFDGSESARSVVMKFRPVCNPSLRRKLL
jgi:hypothetical protein